ncbi:NAD(P)/FAD-dependent oxidoreductase [Sutcliffiella halmapala]|uniref:NAD(P)/FAD-dependent oxidoreductase n=1 Tax=Sutcliffiella halmapala TaxID=79882 RepID=UPI000995CC1B|nr:NAD(P)/FAD-dependent oxidoreductase [Sutcliffiella halmapala]
MNYKIAIVGGGPSGIGFGILLKQLGIKDFVIIERDEVGSTFYKWPKEMKLITPSFTGHGFGLLDLNAITPDTSPAYTFQKEHISGEEYGDYLAMLAEHYELPIMEYTEVTNIEFKKDNVTFNAGNEKMTVSSLVWATGEYQTPNLTPFEGAELCIHNSQVASWSKMEGQELTIIGGYESGIDAALHLVKNGKNVTVLSKSARWKSNDADPSITLSPYTQERLAQVKKTGRLQLKGDKEVVKIAFLNEEYHIYLTDGSTLRSLTKPILATGFHPGARQLEGLFDWGKDGMPVLTNKDESTKQNNLFLIGPNVRHKEVIFCFIYKYRQRFAIVAEEIIKRLNMEYEESTLEKYKKNQMYLDDLSCCEVKCEC